MRTPRLLRPARPTRPRRAGGARRAAGSRRRRGAGRRPRSGAARGRGSRRRRSRGTSVTASPAAITPRLASGSRETIESRISNPAARQARAIRLSALGAIQRSCASAASGIASTLREPVPGRERDQERLVQQVAPLGALVLAALERRVLEADREVQLAAPDALGQLGRRALLEQHLPEPRARPAARAPTSALGNAPIRSRGGFASSASCRVASANRSAIASACASRTSPAGVSAIALSRSSRRAPTSRSSAATCWETAGCVSASARAAAENDRSCATARKVRTRRGSIRSAYSLAETMICIDGRCRPRLVGMYPINVELLMRRSPQGARATDPVRQPPRKRRRPGAVALLELLARAAPARVVAPDRGVLVDAALLRRPAARPPGGSPGSP